MKQQCVNCKFFSGLIKRVDPVLWDLACQKITSLSFSISWNSKDKQTISICEEMEACKKQGGVCMRYPAQKDPRPVIWDGKDWCGEWKSKE
jgi:hypothetical protein